MAHDILTGMGKVLIAALCLIALPFKASAQDLQGRWRITVPDVPTYAGIALVDAERRALFDDDRGPSWRGYVAHADIAKAEIVITSGIVVSRVFCTVQSVDLLHCRILRPDGSISGPSVLTRIGTGPSNLTSALR